MPSAVERVPAGLDIGRLRHIGHRATGLEVRQDHLLIAAGENIGALGHEVDAAEEDVFSVGAGGRLLGQLERVAAEIGELDDFIALVVMTEDDQALAELVAQRPDSGVALIGRHLEVFARDLLLAQGRSVVFAEGRIGADRLFGNAIGGIELRLDEPR